MKVAPTQSDAFIERDGITYLPVKVAAIRAHLSRDYISKLAKKGTLESIRVGRSYAISEKSLEQFLHSREPVHQSEDRVVVQSMPAVGTSSPFAFASSLVGLAMVLIVFSVSSAHAFSFPVAQAVTAMLTYTHESLFRSRESSVATVASAYESFRSVFAANHEPLEVPGIQARILKDISPVAQDEVVATPRVHEILQLPKSKTVKTAPVSLPVKQVAAVASPVITQSVNAVSFANEFARMREQILSEVRTLISSAAPETTTTVINTPVPILVDSDSDEADDLTGIVDIDNGGTGTSSSPTYGQVLLGNADGSYALVATSSLGITGVSAFTDLSDVPSSLATGDILYADAADHLAALSVGSNGSVLKLVAGVPTWASDLQGSGGAGAWATSSNNLYISPTDSTHVVVVGNTATTTTGTILEVTGNALFRNVITTYNAVVAPSFTATSTATSTFAGGIQTSALNITSTTATSTFANGIQLASGCFRSSDGTCLGSSSVSAFDSLTDVDTTGVAFGGLIQYDGSNWIDVATSTLGINTSDITEGSKLFYTTARVQTYLDSVSKGFFFSTTSANAFLALNQGAAFSTTSANYWETEQTARTADDLTNNSIEDLNDVAAITENYGDIFAWNGSTWTDFATSSLAIALSDTTGTLGATRGGTGLSSVSAAGILVGNYTGTGWQQLSTSTLGLLTTHVAEGSNLYYTDARTQTYLDSVSKGFFFSTTSANAFLAANQGSAFSTTSAINFVNASTTIPKTYSSNTFTGSNVFSGTFTLGSLNGPLQANGGVVSATTSIGVLYGGTGLTSAPSFGQMLVGNAIGGYTQTATSSLGLPTFSDLSNYAAVSSVFGKSWELTTNLFGQTALAPTTTQNIAVSGTGTSTFAGGVEAWRSIAAPYFVATSSTATSTFAGIASQSIIPLTDNTYDLGSPTNRFRDLYLSTASLHLESTSGETGSAKQWKFGIDTGNGSQTGTSTGFFRIQEGNSPMLYLNHQGQLGLGVTDPRARLHIQGNSWLTGISNGTISSSGTTVTGTGTTFLYGFNKLNVGDQILADGEVRTVVSIQSQTQLTIDSAFPSPLAGDTYQWQQPIARFDNSASQTKFIINPGGNVGIGDLNPQGLLSVGAGDKFYIDFNGTVASGTWNGQKIGVAYGGTGTTTIPTYGQVLVGNGSGGYALQATSTLGLGGSGGGSVTSVDASGGTTGLSFSGGPVTTSGTLTLGGILNVANGGTGWGALAAGAVLYGNGTGAVATTSVGSNGQVLALVGGIPRWVATTTLADISGTLAVGKGGTGATTAADARSNLGAAASGANTDITSLSAITLLGQTTLATASSTALSALDYFAIGRTGTTTILGSATSTFGAGIQTTAINVTSSTATSTFANGIQLTGGCFRDASGSCIGGSAVTTLDSLSDVDTTGVAFGGLIQYNGSSWIDVATSTLGINTADIIEGSKLFYTDARVNTYINASTTIPKTYSSNTFTGSNSFSGAFTLGSLNGPLQANGGVVSATTSIGVLYGGTGLTSAPTFGQLLVGNAASGYALTATSSLGLPTFSDLSSYASAASLFGKSWEISGGFLTPTSTIRVNIGQASSTNFSALQARFGTTATSTFGTDGSLTLATALGVGSGGTGATTFSYGLIGSTGGTSALTNFATSTLGLLTTNVTEGSNQYYTTARVQTYLDSVSKGFYFSTTSANYWETEQTARTADDLTNNSIEDLNDVAAITENYGDLFAWNGSTWTDFATSSLAIALSDTTGTLGATRGGTGLSSVAAAGILVGNYAGTGWQQLSTSTLGLLTTHVAEGSNLYYTDARVNTYINASTTIPKTYTANTFTNANTFTGQTTLGDASTTNLTVATLASSSNLVASNSFTFSNVTGFLKATGGTVGTSLVNLASDVVGILPVSRGGTGWNSLASGAILYGNGTGAVATTSAGTAGDVLAYLNGIPTWTATTTLSVGGNAATASALQTARTINGTSFDGTANITVTAASSTLLANSNTFSGNNTFSNPITGSISGNAGTVTNGVYTTTFNGLFDGRLAATTSVASITTLGNLSITKSQVSDFGTYESPLTFAYPLSRSVNAISLLFGTSSSNTWGGTQTFTNAPVLSTLTGLVGANAGSTYAISTSSLNANITGNAANVTGVVSVANGGTGSTTLTGILKGNGTGQVGTLVVGSGLAFDGTTLSTSGSGITSIGALNQGQTGGTQILSTSTQSFNGLTAGVTIVSSGNEHTFTPTLSGTLNVSGGGTGASSFSYGLVLSPGGTAALTNVATSSLGLLTTHVAEGSNLYYTDARVNTYINASTTIPKTYTANTFTNTNTFSGQTNLGNASTTNLTVATLASTSQLVASNSFTFSNVTGFLKATAGVVATAAIDLANDVTGILGVQRGGTGWENVAANAVLFGNGTNALATTTAGTNGQVLALVGGVPTWQATTTLTTIGGTLAVGKGGTGITGTPTFGQILVGNGTNYTLTATTSLGLPTFSDLSTYATLSSIFGKSWEMTNSTTLSPTSSVGILVSASSTFNGNLVITGNATATNATTSKFAISSIASGSLLKTTTGGAVVAAVAGADYAVAGSSPFGKTWEISGGQLSPTTTLVTNIGQASSTNFSALQARFGATATSTFGTDGSLTLASALGVVSGGTGWGNVQANSLLLGNGTGALATTSVGTNGQMLALVGGVPSWVSTSTLTTISGTLSVGKGGTGITNTPSFGEILVGNGTNYTLTATSSIGLPTFSDLANYASISAIFGKTWEVSNGALSPTSSIGIVVSASSTFNSNVVITGNATATNATTSNFAVSGTASSSRLVASNAFTFGTVTGFLKATAGVVATAAIDLANDVTGILGVQRGGTGWNSVATGALLFGNGTNALATTSVGTNGQVLALVGGTPTWVATTTLADISGTLSVAKGGTGAGTFSSSQLLYGNGTGALQSVATSSLSVSNGISVSAGSLGYQIGGSNVTLGLASIAANSLLANATGAAGVPTAVSTTTLFGTLGTPGQVLMSNGTSVVWAATSTCIQITGSAELCDGDDATGGGGADFGKTFEISDAALSPTTTLGIIVSASSTIGGGAQATGLTISGGATTTGNLTLSTAGSLISFNNSDVTLTHSSNLLTLAGGNFTLGSNTLTAGAVLASSNDVGALGASGTAWSDLFLASGGVINWLAGDVTITHAADTLTLAGAASGYIFSDGNVGIGSTTPSAKLSVTNSGAGPSFIVEDTTSADISPFIIDTNGNVGIGTTTPAHKLSIQGTSAAPSLSTVNGIFQIGGSVTPALEFGGYSATPFGMWMQTTRYAHDGTSYPLSINPLGGNVGIGTSSPTYVLNSFSSSAAQLALSAGAGTAQWAFRNAGGNLYLATTTVAGTATTSISALEISGSGFGTTTVRGLNIAGQATTTSNVGINLSAGCFAVNDTCIGASSGANFGKTWEMLNASTLTPTTTLGVLVSASSTFNSDIVITGNSTTTNATTTNLAISNALRFGGVSGTAWADFCTTITGSASLCDGDDATGGGGVAFGKTFEISDLALSPTSTLGILISASSTIGAGGQTTGLTISGGATTTGNAYFAGNVGIGTTSPYRKLSLTGNDGNPQFALAYDTANVVNFLADASGNLKLLPSAQTVYMDSAAATFLLYDGSGNQDIVLRSNANTLLNAGNVGIGTTSPWAKLSVVDSNTAYTTPSFVVATTSAWINGAQQPMLYVTATTTGDLNFSRVAIGTTTVWGGAGLRDQFTVDGRIYQTWYYLKCMAGSSAASAALGADASGACGDFAYDFTTDASLVPRSGYPPATRLRAGIAASLLTTEGGALRTAGSIAPATSSPVFEARVRHAPGTAGMGTSTRIVGFADVAFGSVSAAPTNGVYFAASTTNAAGVGGWHAVVRKGGVETSVRNVTATSTEFQRLRIEIASSTTGLMKATFLVNGVVVTEMITQQPNSAMAPMVMIAGNASMPGGAVGQVNTNDLDISYIQVWVDDPMGATDTSSAPELFGDPGDTEDYRIQGAEIAANFLSGSAQQFAFGMLVSNSTTTAHGVIERSTGTYDDEVLGVVVENAEHTLGDVSSTTIHVAFAGRTEVSVSRENGAIQRGDRIVASSIPGIGMKSSRPGYILGRALESFATEAVCDQELRKEIEVAGVVLPADECVRRILVSVDPGFDMNMKTYFQAATEVIKTPAQAMNEFMADTWKDGLELTKFVVGQVVAKIGIFEKLFTKELYAENIFAETVITSKLCLDDVCVTKSELKSLLNQAGLLSAPVPQLVPHEEVIDVPVVTPEEEESTVQEVAVPQVPEDKDEVSIEEPAASNDEENVIPVEAMNQEIPNTDETVSPAPLETVQIESDIPPEEASVLETP